MSYTITSPTDSHYPQVARAVELVRQRLGFRGEVVVFQTLDGPFGRSPLGHSKLDGSLIKLAARLERMSYDEVVECLVHEGVHALGMRHADYYRSHGGERCAHHWDVLSHVVAGLVVGRLSWQQTKEVYRRKKALLRRVALVEMLVERKTGIKAPLGGCDGLVDLHDGRAVRWQQMSPDERKAQKRAMYVGRMKKLGWTMYPAGLEWLESR